MSVATCSDVLFRCGCPATIGEVMTGAEQLKLKRYDKGKLVDAKDLAPTLDGFCDLSALADADEMRWRPKRVVPRSFAFTEIRSQCSSRFCRAPGSRHAGRRNRETGPSACLFLRSES